MPTKFFLRIQLRNLWRAAPAPLFWQYINEDFRIYISFSGLGSDFCQQSYLTCRNKIRRQFNSMPKTDSAYVSNILAKKCSIGRVVLRISVFPPTRIFNVPSRARLAGLVIGASRKYPPKSIISFGIRWVDTGNTAEQPTIIVPIFYKDNIPSSPVITASTYR